MRSGSTKASTSTQLAEVDRSWTGRAANFCAAAARSRSSSRRTSICRRREPAAQSARAHHRAPARGELKKTRILEIYLNVIEWGDGIYGAEAAARTYFHTSAASSDARKRRCLPAPSSTRGCSIRHARRRGLMRRQQIILQRMGAVEPSAGGRRAEFVKNRAAKTVRSA